MGSVFFYSEQTEHRSKNSEQADLLSIFVNVKCTDFEKEQLWINKWEIGSGSGANKQYVVILSQNHEVEIISARLYVLLTDKILQSNPPPM